MARKVREALVVLADEKVLYEKIYPRRSVEEEERETEALMKEYMENIGPSSRTFDDFCREIRERTKLVFLPKRRQGARDFVDLAIRTSKFYELDTRIEQMASHISVSYSFDCCGDMKYLMPVVRQADGISFMVGSNEHEITLTLDYYTHAEYFNGMLQQPGEWIP